MNGQTSLVVILLLLVMLAGAALFLVSLAQTINQDEYVNLFAHNLLVAALRTDTGYSDTECRTAAEATACAFFKPGYACSNVVPCTQVAARTLEETVAKTADLRKNFRILLVVESEGFVARSPTGEPFRLEVGDTSVKTLKGKRYVANERIQKVLATGVYSLKATVMIAPK